MSGMLARQVERVRLTHLKTAYGTAGSAKGMPFIEKTIRQHAAGHSRP